MKPYYQDAFVTIYHGDNREILPELSEIHALVTDAPYGLDFMNAVWDSEVPGVDYWVPAKRALLPGAFIAVMGGTRTFHRLVCAIEDSGFYIRDRAIDFGETMELMWVYGSGFPKSHNVSLGIDKIKGFGNRGKAIPTASTYQACDTEKKNKLEANPVPDYEPKTLEAKEWAGWGTALKPAYEPICLARKPFKGSVARNVLKHGTGALNIDGCRVGISGVVKKQNIEKNSAGFGGKGYGCNGDLIDLEKGRWPANVLHDGSGEVLACFPDAPGQLAPAGGPSEGYGGGFKSRPGYKYDGPPSPNVNVGGGQINCQYQDSGSAARFFYCAKATKEEREHGLFDRCSERAGDGRSVLNDTAYQRGKTLRKNTHPTVKPIALMKWLVTLITPPKGIVLDPFMGSGTTIWAAKELGIRAIGIDITEKYCEIAAKRLSQEVLDFSQGILSLRRDR